MKWQKIVNELEGEMTKLQLDMSNCDASIIESEFAVKLPQELITFYSETNGISELIRVETMDDWIESGDLVWSVERLIEENRSYRANEDFKRIYMPFECLLFIGDTGNGDNFGYSIHEGEIWKTDIYAWNHEDDSRNWVAPDLETFVKWWTSGKIKI
ncbi:MAG: SMI1/KNR4 family protein [Saprospiraceae bacterium]